MEDKLTKLQIGLENGNKRPRSIDYLASNDKRLQIFLSIKFFRRKSQISLDKIIYLNLEYLSYFFLCNPKQRSLLLQVIELGPKIKRINLELYGTISKEGILYRKFFPHLRETLKKKANLGMKVKYFKFDGEFSRLANAVETKHVYLLSLISRLVDAEVALGGYLKLAVEDVKHFYISLDYLSRQRNWQTCKLNLSYSGNSLFRKYCKSRGLFIRPLRY